MSKQRQNSQFNQCLLGPLMQSLDMHTLHFVFLPLVLVEHTSHSALSKQGPSSSGETNNQLCSRLPGGGGDINNQRTTTGSSQQVPVLLPKRIA